MTATDARGTATFAAAVTYVAPPPVVIEAVTPSVISTVAGTRVAFTGQNFSAGLLPALGAAYLTDVSFVSSTRIEGTSPALAAGFHDAHLFVAGVIEPVASLSRAVEARVPVALRGVDPSVVSTEGTTAVEVTGNNFRSDVVIRFGGKDLAGQTVVSSTLIRGTAPSHTAGPKDVTADDAVSAAVLPGGVTYEEPVPEVRITAVDPSRVESMGGEWIAFTGENLTANHRPYIGHYPLGEVRWQGEDRITGRTQSMEPGIYDAIIIDSALERVAARLQRAVEVLAREEVLPAPREFDTSLAEGTARFEWFNPVPYTRIVVEDPEGNLVAQLPGDATFLEVSAIGVDQMGLEFRGEVEAIVSPPAGAMARIYNCERPPPLYGDGSQSGPVEFTLYGGPPHVNIIPVELDVWVQLEGKRSGSASPHRKDDLISIYDIPAQNLEVQEEGTVGHIQSYVFRNSIPPPVQYRSKVSTGFVLQQPTTKLEIAGYYEKIATAPDLELRGRITLVHAADPAQPLDVRAEFLFPDILISNPPPCEKADGGGGDFPVQFEVMLLTGKKWNETIVMRTPSSPGDDTIVVCPPPEELEAFPAGEYLLDVFVVGGDPRLPYYLFADDLRQFEILIPGVPCPPYPLVKVTDMQGLRTLPVVDRITARAYLMPTALKDIMPLHNMVTFTAHGFWTDFDDSCYVIEESDMGAYVDPAADPDGDPPPMVYPDAYRQHPGVRYQWKFREYTPAISKETSSNRLDHFVPYGTYRIDLTVSDKACGFSKKRSFEVVVVPSGLDCPTRPYDFVFPTPDPAGIYAVLGLAGSARPAGPGRFEGQRPLEIRVLVVPGCGADSCVQPPCCPMNCDAPFTDECDPAASDILLRLAWNTPQEDDQGIQPANRHELYIPRVIDLSPNTSSGPKYYEVVVDDLATIPRIPSTFDWVHVYLQAKARSGSDQWADVHEQPMNFINSPRVLDTSFWSGNFNEEDASYHFVAKSAEETETGFPAPQSESFDMMGLAEVPSKSNDVGAGFTSRFQMTGGQWLPETGTGTSSGEVMSNQVNSAPLNLQGSFEGGKGEGGGGGLTDYIYKWCSHDVIVSGSFREQILNAVIYTGTIGPVPVTIWASIGLGLEYCVQSYISVFVRPFVESGARVESHFQLLSNVAIQIPCEVRADILGGIINISIGLIPEAVFEFDTDVATYDADLFANFYIGAVLNLYMFFKGCVDLLLVEICVGWEVPIFEGLPLIPETGRCPRLYTCDNPEGVQLVCPENRPCGAKGEGEGLDSSKDDPIPATHILQVISAPALSTHPDGTTIGTYSTGDNEGYIFIGDMNSGGIPGSGGRLLYRDADASFIAGAAQAEIALVSWTRLASTIDLNLPEDTGARRILLENDLSLRNEVSRRADIIISPVYKDSIQTWQMGGMTYPQFAVSDEPGDEDYTADGRSSIAGSLAHGDALVAWVRYETPAMLIPDGTTTVRRNMADVEPGECVPGTTTGSIARGFWCDVEVPNIRPQMEQTAIYARRATHEGPIDAKRRISPPGPCINIEPSLALSPDGEIAYCVWVHDPAHINLIDSNLGRNLYYAVWNRAADAWSTPQPVFSGDVDPDDTPGMLQPSIALKASHDGLLAFTAVAPDAVTSNSGIGGGSRFVYISRLEGGVFGPPELIHQTCRLMQYGEWTAIDLPQPPLAQDPRPWKVREPEAVIHWMRSGYLGSKESSGGWMLSVIGQGMTQPTEPVNMLPEGVIQTNMAFSAGGGSVHAIHLNCGSSSLQAFKERGFKRSLDNAFFEHTSFELAPDLAIADCHLSHQFAAPGSSVTARIKIENKGLAGSAIHPTTEASLVGIRIVFIDDVEHLAREVARDALPEMQPGENVEIELPLEMPHDPVRLRVEIDPNHGDRDPSNDWWECFFGAPPPASVICEEVLLPGGRGRAGMQVTWESPIIYDEILVYRGGEMRAALPGGTKVYVDQYREELEGKSVDYAVRGRLGASSSHRVACSTGPAPALFRRGDSDGSGTRDISDGIFIFNYLFLGGRTPECMSAADVNADARVDISDGIYLLSFLFLGGSPPPAPFPDCGVEPVNLGLPCVTQPECR
ncbi:MAG: IPT/TIG domain-containing protein [Planctomycetes bacterium]|nr:IPT/TIG domain-containing protein [Planctomycetota bacterium]